MSRTKQPGDGGPVGRTRRKGAGDAHLDERVQWNGKLTRRLLQAIRSRVLEEKSAKGVTNLKSISQASIVERLLREKLGLSALEERDDA